MQGNGPNPYFDADEGVEGRGGCLFDLRFYGPVNTITVLSSHYTQRRVEPLYTEPYVKPLYTEP